MIVVKRNAIFPVYVHKSNVDGVWLRTRDAMPRVRVSNEIVHNENGQLGVFLPMWMMPGRL